MPTQEQIDEDLYAADNGFLGDRSRRLAAACRSEKARADLLERQYAELAQWVQNPARREAHPFYDMHARHVAERAALKENN